MKNFTPIISIIISLIILINCQDTVSNSTLEIALEESGKFKNNKIQFLKMFKML
jgi:hypothetical protein